MRSSPQEGSHPAADTPLPRLNAIRSGPVQTTTWEVTLARRRGDRIGARWRLGDELPGTDELRRYRLRDLETGDSMELWEPRASVRLRPGVDEALRAATRSSPTADAALARIPISTDQGTVLITRSTAGSLAERDLLLGPDQAIQLARWLSPAILDPRSSTGGRLRPDDIVLDEDGVPHLLSLGLPPAEAVLEVPHHTAPEVLRGAAGDAASGLYGLGVVLFEGLTGAKPVPARNLQDLLERRPEAMRPSTLRPDLPPAVDILVQGLLSEDPGRRVAAVRDLGAWSGEPPTLDLAPAGAPDRPSLPAAPSTVTTRAMTARPGHHLVVARVRDLSPSATYLVAALAGLDEATIERAAGRRQGVVVAGLASGEEAEALARRLGAHGIKARVRGTTSTGRGALGLAALLAILIAGASLLISPVVSLVAAVMGFTLALLAWSRAPRSLRRGPGPARNALPEVAHLQQRVDRLAVRLVGLELPEPVARDVRDDLLHIHRRVAELARSRAELTRSLHSIDDAEAGAPLRRSVAAIDREFDEISDVLDELEAMLASQVEADRRHTGTEALDRLNQRIQALRAARSELNAPSDAERALNRRRQAAAKQRAGQ